MFHTPQRFLNHFSIVPTAFKLLESSSQKFLQGLVYLIGNLLGLALAVYKCQSMGLLPTHASDWLAFIEPPEVSMKNCLPTPPLDHLLTSLYLFLRGGGDGLQDKFLGSKLPSLFLHA